MTKYVKPPSHLAPPLTHLKGARRSN